MRQTRSLLTPASILGRGLGSPVQVDLNRSRSNATGSVMHLTGSEGRVIGPRNPEPHISRRWSNSWLLFYYAWKPFKFLEATQTLSVRQPPSNTSNSNHTESVNSPPNDGYGFFLGPGHLYAASASSEPVFFFNLVSLYEPVTTPLFRLLASGDILGRGPGSPVQVDLNLSRSNATGSVLLFRADLSLQKQSLSMC